MSALLMLPPLPPSLFLPFVLLIKSPRPLFTLIAVGAVSAIFFIPSAVNSARACVSLMFVKS